jgi:hypothetical protein
MASLGSGVRVDKSGLTDKIGKECGNGLFTAWAFKRVRFIFEFLLKGLHFTLFFIILNGCDF